MIYQWLNIVIVGQKYDHVNLQRHGGELSQQELTVVLRPLLVFQLGGTPATFSQQTGTICPLPSWMFDLSLYVVFIRRRTEQYSCFWRQIQWMRTTMWIPSGTVTCHSLIIIIYQHLAQCLPLHISLLPFNSTLFISCSSLCNGVRRNFYRNQTQAKIWSNPCMPRGIFKML